MDVCLVVDFVDFVETNISPESFEECPGKLWEYNHDDLAVFTDIGCIASSTA